MFDLIRNNPRVAQVILAILILPFAAFGLDSYFHRAPGSEVLVHVGDEAITAGQFERELEDRRRLLRAQFEGQIDEAMLNSPLMRRALLEEMIRSNLLAQYARDEYMVAEPQLRKFIAEAPAFQEDGAFSTARYVEVLRSQGQTPVQFESLQSQYLMQQQVKAVFERSATVDPASMRRLLAGQTQTRTVRQIRIDKEVAEADEAAVQAYYEEHGARFEQPMRIKAEYVVLDQAGVAAKIKIDEAQARRFYEDNSARFATPAAHHVRHILLDLPSEAEAAQKARDEAADLLARLRAKSATFDELAQAFSQDAGTAEKGGDLGFVTAGALGDAALDEAIFALREPGQISDVVTSASGLHLIELVAVRAREQEPFEAVREQIEADLRERDAAQEFAAMAEQFANVVYEQGDSLTPVAEKFGLQLQTTSWLQNVPASAAPFDHQGLREALFSDDVSVQGHNTDAVEIERGTLVAARALEVKPAARLPLAEVRDQIVSELHLAAKTRAASEAGEAMLKKLLAGEAVQAQWQAEQVVSRDDSALEAGAVAAVFAVDLVKLPAWTGVPLADGSFAVFEIVAASTPEIAADDERLTTMQANYSDLFGSYEEEAFVEVLRARYKIEINENVIRQAWREESAAF